VSATKGFAATKFDREYDLPRQQLCDEDCAEFLSGARFDIPFPATARYADAEKLRIMRDALQKAWIVLDALRSYRPGSELLDLINSDLLADAREAVRVAGSLQIAKDL
jgi:hypothetical protein